MNLFSTDVGWNTRDSPEIRKWRKPGYVQTEYLWKRVGWVASLVS